MTGNAWHTAQTPSPLRVTSTCRLSVPLVTVTVAVPPSAEMPSMLAPGWATRPSDVTRLMSLTLFQAVPLNR